MITNELVGSDHVWWNRYEKSRFKLYDEASSRYGW
jgi:hypothetical protein